MNTVFEIILIIVIALTIIPFLSLAPFAPTRAKDLSRINKIIKLSPGEKVLEIGCGTANVSYYLAKQNTSSQIVGIEFSLAIYLIAVTKAYLRGLDNLKIIYGNALKHDFSSYDAFYIFGMEKALEKKILPKLDLEMKKDSRLLSYCFKIENWKGTEIKNKDKKDELAIYEYRK